MNCANLSLIPQFSGTCWFNVLLVASLYSQHTRKNIIKASKTWNKNDSFLMIIKLILKNYKKPNKVQSFFKNTKPETILMKMIYKYNFNKIIKNDFKLNLKINNGAYISDIIYFLNSINSNKVLEITYYKKYYYLNLFKIIDSSRRTCNLDINSISFYNETKKIINEVPDILIVNHYNYYNNLNYTFNYLYNLPRNYNYYNLPKKWNKKFNFLCPISIFNKIVLKSYLYNFNILGLDIGNDIIYLNGHKYILDSVLLGNYNKNEINSGHTIVGITCNNKRYIYNSTNRKNKNSPCPLMRYNWNINKDNDFNINTKLCNLDFDINENNYCFNFSKGDRVLIYSRIIDDEIESNSSIDSQLKLSNVSEMVKDLYDIKNMTRSQVINNLIILNKDIFKNNNYKLKFDKYNDNQLRNIYANDLKKHYNLSKSADLNEEYKEIKKNNIYNLLKNITKDNLIEFIKNLFNIKTKIIENKTKDEIKEIIAENIINVQ